ncbi:MAG: HAD family hydrolase [Hyphomicrobiaceae bacterium]|nr:MAG: HAD family hydrolase [Hyphomicrobiaceae bacterium]
MPTIRCGGKSMRCRLVIFDKDGTLIDFNRIWWGRLERGVAQIMARLNPSPEVEGALYQTLGADRNARVIRPETPYAVTSNAKICTVAATVLHQSGLGWADAEAIVEATLKQSILAPPEPQEILPLADLPSLFRSLRAAGIAVAVATSDDRAGTETTLRQLGLDGLVARLLCADDPGPRKPDPAAIAGLARDLGVVSQETAIVSDSASDLEMGLHAGVGMKVGVLSGTGRRRDFDNLADAVIGSVGEMVAIAD